MKEFIVRLFSLLAIVGVLFGYNEVLDVRAKDEEIAKLNALPPSPAISVMDTILSLRMVTFMLS